jgi:DNA-binding transcriptional ArsR family regulator
MQDSLRNFKADFFKALAHPARIKILELLRDGELSVTELQDRLKIDSSSVSQQLSILRHKNIVQGRKAGTTVFYRVRDSEVFELLDVARRIFNNQLLDTRSTLEQLEEEKTQDDFNLDKKRTSSISM